MNAICLEFWLRACEISHPIAKSTAAAGSFTLACIRSARIAALAGQWLIAAGTALPMLTSLVGLNSEERRNTMYTVSEIHEIGKAQDMILFQPVKDDLPADDTSPIQSVADADFDE